MSKLGGKPVEDALEEELAKFVKQEDEAKFRCVPECTNSSKRRISGESMSRSVIQTGLRASRKTYVTSTLCYAIFSSIDAPVTNF
jgi:hypothetical protein